MAEATPTPAECWEMVREACEIVWDEWANARGNFLTNLDNLIQDVEGSVAKQAIPVVANVRQSYAALLGQGRALLEPLLRELARSYGITAGGGAASLAALYEELEANSDTVLRRNVTRGSATYGGSNVGDGTVIATTTDRYSHAIEDGVATTTALACVRDQSTGAAAGSEAFEVSDDGVAPLDAIALPAGGLTTITVTSMLRGGGVLQNPSFDANTANADATGDGSKFSGWKAAGANANMTHSDAEYFVVAPNRALVSSGSPHGRSAVFTGDDAVYQELRGLRDDVPYACVVRYKFSGVSSGTLTARVGSASQTATYADTNWHDLIVIGADQNAWYRNFQAAADPTKLELEITSHTANACYVDDVVLAELVYVNGRWMLPVSGQTGWRNQNDASGDSITFTDTLPSGVGEGIIQTVLNKLFPRAGRWPGYLPHAVSASETIADP